MKSLDFSLALWSCVAAVMLAGCGGAQTVAAGTVPAADGHSRKATSSDSNLLYVSSNNQGPVDVYTYPGGSHLAHFTTPDNTVPDAMCSDAFGNVFITAYDNSAAAGYIFEYSHGGTTPTTTLSDGSYEPDGCSVDPTTENLAVANNVFDEQGAGNVAIFTDAQGSPTDYTDSAFLSYEDAAYDGSGDLFIYGGDDKFAELPAGEGTFANISISGLKLPRAIQWDGKYLAILCGKVSTKSHQTVSRVQVSGSEGTVVGSTRFKGLLHKPGAAFWIQGNEVAVRAGETKAKGTEVGIFDYPAGGKPVGIISTGQNLDFMLTVSVAPSHKAHRR